MPPLVIDAIHFDQLREHGGVAGIRDRDALEAALARPRHKWAYRPRADLALLAAAYGFGLARNHPFRDGNKRVAFLAMVVFLELNGAGFDAPDAEVVTVMTAVASGAMSEAQLARWVRRSITPEATSA
jgi:death-on-curing protein